MKIEKIKDDIHGNRHKYENAKQNIVKWFSSENATIVIRFTESLRLQGKSYSRLRIYANCSISLLKMKDDSPLEKWTKDEIQEIIMKLRDNTRYKAETKILVALTLKRLVHFAKCNEIIDKNLDYDKEYDESVGWIRPTMFRDKSETIKPTDLLTDEEMLKLIEASKKIGGRYVKRNVAILYCLFDGAFRPSELLNIKIGNVFFSEDHYKVNTTGKTGDKSLTLVTSMIPLKEWLAEHPKSSDYDAYVFYDNNEEERIPYGKLKKFMKKIQYESGVKKRIFSYLFRHSSITQYVKLLKSPQLVKRYGNWTKNSNMINRYTHLADSDQEDAILALHGLKKKDEGKVSILFSKICPGCKERNSADKSHCTKCGTILSMKLAQEREAKKLNEIRQIEKSFSSTVKELQKAILEQQSKLDEILKGKN